MAAIADIGQRLRAIDWSSADEPEVPAPVAQFAAWTEALVAKVQAKMTLLTIQSAKVLLLDRFMQWQADTPKKRRLKHGCAGEPTLWYVFETTYETLREMELALVPVLQPTATAQEEPAPFGILVGEQGS